MDNQSLGRLIPISAIYPSSTNPRKRFNETDLQELAESIKQHGVMQPILVRPTNVEAVNNSSTLLYTYEIVAGERRWRASKLAGKESIPAIERVLNDLETLQLQIIENLQRSDLHPLEEAQGFKALLDNKDAKSWNADQLAEKIGKSRSYIYASLKLCELSTYAQDMFLDDKYGREIALLIARIPGAKLQEQAAKSIISSELSYRRAKDYIRQNFTLDLSKAPWDKVSITLYPPAGSCLSCPKRTGNYPELFPDIESADVCTDTACFAAKKVAYANEIIASNPRVIHGEEAKTTAPYGVNHYITNGYTADGNRLILDGHSSEFLLGSEMPAPYILIDEHNDSRSVHKVEEVESLMKLKLQEKIASGEIVITPREKTEYELKQEELTTRQNIEAERRLHIFNRISTQIALEHQTPILNLAIHLLSRNSRRDFTPIFNIFDFNGSEKAFFADFTQKKQTLHSLLKMLAMLLIIPGTEVNQWGWQSEEDNANDQEYQDLIRFIRDIGLDLSQVLTAELALTPNPAAQAQELNADAAAAANENLVLSPKLQEIKDRELAKRARRSESKKQKESATADL